MIWMDGQRMDKKVRPQSFVYQIISNVYIYKKKRTMSNNSQCLLKYPQNYVTLIYRFHNHEIYHCSFYVKDILRKLYYVLVC